VKSCYIRDRCSYHHLTGWNGGKEPWSALPKDLQQTISRTSPRSQNNLLQFTCCGS